MGLYFVAMLYTSRKIFSVCCACGKM